MNGRRAVGAVLLVGGLAVAAVGLAGLLGSGGGTAVVTPTAAQTSAATGAAEATPIAPSPSLTPSTVAPPTAAAPSAAPSLDALALIRAFFVDLEAAIRDGNQESLVASLGGAVIDRYGVSECESTLASRDPSPQQAFEILSIAGPDAWDYVTDGLTTTIPNAYTVQARVTGPTASGAVVTQDAELHVTIGDGTVLWYTDCGDPLSS
jgi:hypothetical protein